MNSEDIEIVIGEGARELSVLDDFQKAVKAEIDSVIEGNIYRNVINAGSVGPLDVMSKSDRIEVLEELQRYAYGKVVQVRNEAGETQFYRLAQANWSVLNDNIMVVNRLAPLAAELAPAEVGDIIGFPDGSGAEVVSIDLLDRYPSTLR